MLHFEVQLFFSLKSVSYIPTFEKKPLAAISQRFTNSSTWFSFKSGNVWLSLTQSSPRRRRRLLLFFCASARSNRPTFGANILTSLAGSPSFKSDLDRLLVHFFYLQILFSAVKNGCEIKDIAHTSHNFLLQLMLVVLFWNTNVAQCYL